MLHGLLEPYTKLEVPRTFVHDLSRHWQTAERNEKSSPLNNPACTLTKRTILYCRPASGFSEDNYDFSFPLQKTYFGDFDQFIQNFKTSYSDVDFNDFGVAQAICVWLETVVLRYKELTGSKKAAHDYITKLRKKWFLPHMASLEDMSEVTLASALYNVKLLKERFIMNSFYPLDMDYLARYIMKIEMELTKRRSYYLENDVPISTR